MIVLKVAKKIECTNERTKAMEKGSDDADQIAQRQVSIGNYALDLMKLGQMSSVYGFIAEDAIN